MKSRLGPGLHGMIITVLGLVSVCARGGWRARLRLWFGDSGEGIFWALWSFQRNGQAAVRVKTGLWGVWFREDRKI